MKFPLRLGWLAMAGLGLALTFILAFLYVKMQELDAPDYFENVALLRQLKQLHAGWELDVMRSEIGINRHYDALVEPLSDLDRLREMLNAVVAGRPDAEGAALAQANQAFARAMDDKIRLVEQFKSHHSVLRNSLAFLPTAARDATVIQTLADQLELALVEGPAAEIQARLVALEPPLLSLIEALDAQLAADAA